VKVQVIYLAEEHSVHNFSFEIGKEIKSFEVLQTKIKNDTEDGTYLVIMRSVGGFTAPEEEEDASHDGDHSFEDENSNHFVPAVARHKSESLHVANPTLSPQMPKIVPGPVEKSLCYIFGYSIIPSEFENQCQIQVLSQYSSDLQKLEVDYVFCRKLKQFIEELTMLTDTQIDNSDPKRTALFGGEKRMRNKIVIC
jgi:hypothetical protein